MAATLNSAILKLGLLDLAILVFPVKLTHTCQDWFPPFAQKNLHSFILTQLDDGSHLEFYHVGLRKLHSFIPTQLDDGSHLEFYHIGFRHCHLGFRHLLIFSQIHSKTLSLHYDSWLKLIQSDSNLFILTQLDDGSHLEFYHVWLRKLHSFILTQLDDGSHLEFYHIGFRHCHLRFRHLLIFSQIHSKTLSLHFDSDSN